jgi:hypothetical protein
MSEYDRRKQLTFQQAEGLESLPTQLRYDEISPSLRSNVWAFFYQSYASNAHHGFIQGYWNELLFDFHVKYLHFPADKYSSYSENATKELKARIHSKKYTDFYGVIQWIIRHKSFPVRFKEDLAVIFEDEQAGYRLIAGDTFVPYSTKEELSALTTAIEDLTASHLRGALQHLKAAARALGERQYSDSVRESVHAVESTARSLAPDTKLLSDALNALEKKQTIHTAMKRGFNSIYGYTNDEQGIRHSLIDQGDANVDEADALFMLGACAAFVSYLLNKARSADISV